MKLEYFDIKIRLELLSKQAPELQQRMFQNLLPKLRQNWIRFELYFEPEYYQKIISLAQEELSALVKMQKYSECPDVRDKILFYQNRLQDQIILFQNTTPPQYILNQRGLILTFLNSEGDSHLRHLIDSYSMFKTM